MAAQKRTGWGSFLSQAVAGVEARLDNILAEEGDGSVQQKEANLPASSTPTPATSVKQSPGMHYVSIVTTSPLTCRS
jgi:hypothetical protein